VKYFNGFSLFREESLFDRYIIDDNDFTVVGFSYGAQQAFEYLYQEREDRIEKLILLSPAYFQDEKRSFVRTQLRYFDQDRESYVEQFLKNVSYPSSIDLKKYLNIGSREELDLLLRYRWESEKVKELLDRGVDIEVYLGGRDKIIDSSKAFEFFSSLTTTYLIKDSGHLLSNQTMQ